MYICIVTFPSEKTDPQIHINTQNLIIELLLASDNNKLYHLISFMGKNYHINIDDYSWLRRALAPKNIIFIFSIVIFINTSYCG